MEDNNRPTRKTRMAIVLTAISAAFLVPGLFTPSFTVIPSIGDEAADALLLLYFPNIMRQHSYSIFTTIETLFAANQVGLGLVILCFSVLFPLAKLIALSVVLWEQSKFQPDWKISRLANRMHKYCLEFVIILGSWSMLDVFVVAIFVVGSKQLPGGTKIVAGYGLLLFGVSVFLTMLAAIVAKRIYLNEVT